MEDEEISGELDRASGNKIRVKTGPKPCLKKLKTEGFRGIEDSKGEKETLTAAKVLVAVGAGRILPTGS